MTTMQWTDERVEKLKRLWAEGLVIGKVHRLNLPGRAKAGGSSSAARPAKRPAQTPRPAAFQNRPAANTSTRTVTRTAGATALKEEIEVEAYEEVEVRRSLNVVVPISRRLALTELTERTCKWPIGDPMKEDFHFCGCEIADSAPYCTYHAKLAYQPVSERRKAAR
jgi:GcrA cell cycle regulator